MGNYVFGMQYTTEKWDMMSQGVITDENAKINLGTSVVDLSDSI